MPRQPTQAEVFDALLAKYEVEIGDAMRAAFADLRDKADQQAVIAALERGDIEGAIRALHLDPAAFHQMDRAQRDAFTAAGLAAILALPVLTDIFGARIVIRFNPSSPAASAALDKATAQATSRLMDDQIQAIRSLVQERLAANADPKTIALEIVGRIGPSGAREGGIIGLSSTQAQFVESARAELASGDAAMLRNYLARSLRDSRFDAQVRAAIESGQPVDSAIADRAVQSYANRLLLQRGRTVGLAQAQDLLHSGQNEAMNQAIASGGLSGAEVVGDWRTVGDDRVRFSHAMLDGETKPHGEPFVSPLGNLMRWPGDTAYGAGPEDLANCRCSLLQRIVFRPNEQRAAA